MSSKQDSYFNTIREKEWGNVDDKLKEVIFHRYFYGKGKGGKWGDKWEEDNKFTKRLFTFFSKRKFDENGELIGKVCNYSGKLYPIEEFPKDKKSRDGYTSRIRKYMGKTNRR